jgi:hypothetical protein
MAKCGTTASGGASNVGVVFEWDPANQCLYQHGTGISALPYGANTTIIKQFDGVSGGAANNNEMIVYNNKLYGCLNAAGVNSQGTLFELDPVGNVFTKLVDFNYTTTGGGPLGKLVVNGTKFLGMCTTGGTNGTGSINDPTSQDCKNMIFQSIIITTINPGNGSLVLINTKFYATHTMPVLQTRALCLNMIIQPIW